MVPSNANLQRKSRKTKIKASAAKQQPLLTSDKIQVEERRVHWNSAASKAVRNARIWAGFAGGAKLDRQKVSQHHLAKLIGVETPQISKIERGMSSMSAAHFMEIAATFGISIDSMTGVDKTFKKLKGAKAELMQEIGAMTLQRVRALREFIQLPAWRAVGGLLFAQDIMSDRIRELSEGHLGALRAVADVRVLNAAHDKSLQKAVSAVAVLGPERLAAVGEIAKLLAGRNNPNMLGEVHKLVRTLQTIKKSRDKKIKD